MEIFLDLHAKVSEYLDKHIALWELESWMAPRTLILYDAPDSAVAKLAHVVELHLSELHDGLRTERGLRIALAKYNSQPTLRWFDTMTDSIVATTYAHSNW